MDSLAMTCAFELAAWDVETTIISPGFFVQGTNQFQDAAKPGPPEVARKYGDGPTKVLGEEMMAGTASVVPGDADSSMVADALVELRSLEGRSQIDFSLIRRKMARPSVQLSLTAMQWTCGRLGLEKFVEKLAVSDICSKENQGSIAIHALRI